LYIAAKFKIQKGGREIFDNLIYIYIFIPFGKAQSQKNFSIS